jgi:hypothetical protein
MAFGDGVRRFGIATAPRHTTCTTTRRTTTVAVMVAFMVTVTVVASVRVVRARVIWRHSYVAAFGVAAFGVRRYLVVVVVVLVRERRRGTCVSGRAP